MTRVVLASRSPQRTALLSQIGIAHEIREPDYEELPLGLPPADTVVAYARGKARSIDARGRIVLGVDTDVVVDGEVLGKAKDAATARTLLARLAGREHVVISGVCVRRDDRELVGAEATTVAIRVLSAAEIDGYVASGEWTGRAGAYAIQGAGLGLIERIDGCYANVVGLPLALTQRLLGALADSA